MSLVNGLELNGSHASTKGSLVPGVYMGVDSLEFVQGKENLGQDHVKDQAQM